MRNFIVKVDGKQYEVAVEEVGQTSAPAPALAKPVAAPRTAEFGGTKVLSPFPGLIKNLLAQEGTTVKRDQPILVLEAMKMDNDITAPCDGTVHYSVQKGVNVESDAVLAVIS